MAITVDLDTDIGVVRAWLGDDTDVSGDAVKTRGILPNGENMSDPLIQMLIDGEGGNVMRAVAAAYEFLAARFAQVVTLSEGARSEQLSDVYDNYVALAQEWRDKWGGVATNANTYAVALGRTDGYSTAAGRTDEHGFSTGGGGEFS